MKNILKFLTEPFLNKKLRTVTFFVTNRCNSRCSHCFYWKNLGKTEELPLNKIKKISQSMGDFYYLSISGGEPFLRDDLPEVCSVFYEQNNVRDISIPTNSMQPQKIVETTKEILHDCPKAKISINVSLDGLEKTHDKTRNTKGAFKKVMENIKLLTDLKKISPNLIVNVTTVVSNANLEELEKLSDFIRNNTKVDNHSFEILRGNPKDPKFRRLDPVQFKKLTKLIVDNNYHYFKNKGFFTSLYLKKRQKYFLKQQFLALNDQNWDVPCLAGKTTVVLEPDGTVKPCELLESIGNLKDFDYNLPRLLNSDKAKKIRRWIKESRCSCTHCVALNLSISHNPSAVFIKCWLK